MDAQVTPSAILRKRWNNQIYDLSIPTWIFHVRKFNNGLNYN